MDEKRKSSWLLLSVIHSVAWGMFLAILRPRPIVIIACAVIAFAPLPLAFWLDARNRGKLPTKGQFVTLVALTIALIVVIALAVTSENG
jgi:hypothetical protein